MSLGLVRGGGESQGSIVVLGRERGGVEVGRLGSGEPTWLSARSI